MCITWAITGIVRPSRSSRRTSASRGLSDSPSRSVRRRLSATASPDAVKDVAATAACRIAASTSSTGAAFETKAETPASSAWNSR